MNYNTLSDFEINKRVAELLGRRFEEYGDVLFTSVKHSGDNVVSVQMATDYCNNPSDAWPVIIENKINIMHGWVGNG